MNRLNQLIDQPVVYFRQIEAHKPRQTEHNKQKEIDILFKPHSVLFFATFGCSHAS